MHRDTSLQRDREEHRHRSCVAPLDVQTGAITISVSGNASRIKELAEVSELPDLLHLHEVEDIMNVGKTIHFQFYVGKSFFLLGTTREIDLCCFLQTKHMEEDFLLPDLPGDL